jgi:DNA-binding transcriptional ArsR family regulator
MCFKALQHHIRRKILHLLRRGPKSVVEITEAVAKGARDGSGVAVSRAAISQHLKVLLKAQLVSCTPEGSRNVYRLRREGVVELKEYVEQLLKAAEKG